MFEQARRIMVDRQLRASDVTDHRVLGAMSQVPRERFVPKADRAIAYSGDDLQITAGDGVGYVMMAPRVFAKMLQLAEIKRSDVVLDICCGTGYSSAVLSRLAEAVVALEVDDRLAEQAGSNLLELEYDNAVVVTGALAQGYGEQGPYDVILINGAVQKVPQALFDQLAEAGRLVAIIQDGPVGQAVLYNKRHGLIAARAAFDCCGPALPGFAAAPEFVF